MYARTTVPDGLTRLAYLQDGALTREQVLGAGLSRHVVSRLVTSGTWQRLASGLYLTSSGEPSWRALAWSGVLLGGDRARLGGRAAGHLVGLVDTPPNLFEVLVPSGTGCPVVTGPWQFRRERPGARLGKTAGNPPRIGIEDVVLDLAAAEDDVGRAVTWVTSAVQSRLTTAARIRRAMQARHFVRHRGFLERLLSDVEGGVRSALELSYLRDVERAHGLPPGTRQRKRRRTETDVWYEEFGLLVELDGKVGHTGSGRFRDMRRANSATSDGLATLRYGHADVFGCPCEVAQEVGHNLALRGWTGLVMRCPRCRAEP